MTHRDGLPESFGRGLSDSVARGLRCPVSPRRTLLAENPGLEAWGKPSLWVIITAPWYQSCGGASGFRRAAPGVTPWARATAVTGVSLRA